MTTTGWIPLALSREIEAGTSTGAVLNGAEIVVWRDTSGNPHTWEDRCPHRGMKMSFGFVRGDHIACLYHGWEFGETGHCQKIPAHPALDVPKTICVKTYSVAEAAGMIWVHAPLDAEAPDAPTDFPATAVRSLYLDAPLDATIGALPAIFGAPAEVEGAIATITTDAVTLRIGLQPVSATRCALHITAAGHPETGILLDLLDRAQVLRGMVETQVEAAA